MMMSKIAEQHLSRVACIYIRQSTQGQVRFNQESTERQYNLKNKAQALGWSPEKIRILDRDLGQSATASREDFKTLVSDETRERSFHSKLPAWRARTRIGIVCWSSARSPRRW